MSIALDEDVQDLLDHGQLRRLDLVRFELPGKTVGYHMGGRPYTYNGLTYYPNQWLEMGDMTQSLGSAVTVRTLMFSQIPTDDPDDVIATIESYNYLNALVIISHLAGNPETDAVVGVMASSVYEISEVSFKKSAVSSSGERTVTIIVDLEPPGRSVRGSASVRRSSPEQQFDNDPDDTSLDDVATNITIPEEWGQIVS